ncbi:hypothetical protein EU805_15305 [Salipiger sp. IMCC34102]|nr:hypothetical protein EU805_15305 [Salipiger sp. IMCC34102]
MKIPNKAVLTLLAGYAVLGLLALPLDAYLWRYLHLVLVLIGGIALNVVGGLGAGDAKFMAAAAPMVAAADAGRVLMLLGVCMLLGFAVHRILRATPLRRRVPHWASWDSGRKFPLGLPLALTLLIYLGLAALG